ncbi:MAG: hypothetical protein ACXACI_05445 [Candidatus Hodarchaeales archaeon]|jgi:hypothetical protein
MPVSLVVVTNTDGLPLYFSQLTDLHLEVDHTLFSGFLAAMASFSRAVRRDFQLKDLGLGDIRLFFDHGEKVITIIGILPPKSSTDQINGKMVKNYQRLAYLLGKSFHDTFAAEVDDWQGDSFTFNKFKEVTNSVLGYEGYSLERHIEEMLADFSNGQISQKDLVGQIWALVDEKIDLTEGS